MRQRLAAWLWRLGLVLSVLPGTAPSQTASQQAERPHMDLKPLGFFDSAVTQPCTVTGEQITFNLRPGRRSCTSCFGTCRAACAVCLLVDEDGSRFILNQGLYVSTDRVQYQTVPVEQTAPGTLSARLPAGGDVWIATRPPYGRDGLDRLLADTHGAAGLRVRIAARGGQIVPIFEFGAAESGRPVHWFVAAEDAWETASSLVADAMIRQLAKGGALADELLAKAAVPSSRCYRLTARLNHPSYLTPDGRSFYGGATWADEPPPPEYALIRDEVTAETRARWLGCS